MKNHICTGIVSPVSHALEWSASCPEYASSTHPPCSKATMESLYTHFHYGLRYRTVFVSLDFFCFKMFTSLLSAEWFWMDTLGIWNKWIWIRDPFFFLLVIVSITDVEEIWLKRWKRCCCTVWLKSMNLPQKNIQKEPYVRWKKGFIDGDDDWYEITAKEIRSLGLPVTIRVKNRPSSRK